MKIFVVTLLLLLVACTEDEQFRIPPQQWKDVTITVETRPEPVEVGMDEFIVMATDHRGVPVSNLVISIRTEPSAEWRQCIQDSHSGVYRKAIAVRRKGAPLTVQVRRKSEQGELVFPLVYEARNN